MAEVLHFVTFFYIYARITLQQDTKLQSVMYNKALRQHKGNAFYTLSIVNFISTVLCNWTLLNFIAVAQPSGIQVPNTYFLKNSHKICCFYFVGKTHKSNLGRYNNTIS